MDGMPCWADLTAGGGPEFYAAVLGWSFTTDDVASHHDAVALADGRRVAGLGGPAGAPPGWTVYFAVEDAADAAGATEEAGGQVLHGPDDDGRGGLVVVAVDAGGAPFGFWESDEAASPPAWVEAATAEPGATRTFYAGVLGHTHRPTDEPGTTTLHLDDGPGVRHRGVRGRRAAALAGALRGRRRRRGRRGGRGGGRHRRREGLPTGGARGPHRGAVRGQRLTAPPPGPDLRPRARRRPGPLAARGS